MGSAADDMAKAADLPEGDVIRILLEQHARVHELFAELGRTSGEDKRRAFDELRMLLAVHETAEEQVLRPATTEVVGRDVAEARNHEEEEANEVLARLEDLECDSAEFDELMREFRTSVTEHAEHEENEEFPQVVAEVSEEERRWMGDRLRFAESQAPTHPHPSVAGHALAQSTVGPFAALVDRARDALRGSSH